MPSEDALIEALAAYAHEAWAGWFSWMYAKWCFRHQPDGEPFLTRWSRQASTPYADLSEEEKESDREEARKMIAIMQNHKEP